MKKITKVIYQLADGRKFDDLQMAKTQASNLVAKKIKSFATFVFDDKKEGEKEFNWCEFCSLISANISELAEIVDAWRDMKNIEGEEEDE